jgi:hypothetical protein
MMWRATTLVLLTVAAGCSSDSDGNAQGGGTGSAVNSDGGSTGGSAGSGATAGNSSAAGNNSAGGGASGGPSQGGNTTGVGGGTSTGGSGTSSGGGTNVGGAIVSGGRTGTGGGASGASGASVGGCTSVGSSCNPDTTICCPGAVCVTSTSPDYAGCRQECVTAADCASGCCIPFANIPNKGFCGDASLCQCSAQDEPCGGARQCCDGYSCSTFDATGALACHKACTQNSDCSTNCCVQVTGTADHVCLPAKPFCGP